MEFLVVGFPERRVVQVDDTPRGFTNTVLSLPAGTYTLTLEPPTNFAPPEMTITLEHTSAVDPRTVTFDLLAPPGAPRPPGSRA